MSTPPLTLFPILPSHRHVSCATRLRLLGCLATKDASRAAVGHALNDVQAAQAASLELLGPPHVQVLVQASDVEPRPAVRTCVKMPAPPKVCGRADAATHYATIWAWDVQRCAQCSDIPVQEGLDILARGDARAQVDTMLRDGRMACAPRRRCVHRCVVQFRTPVPPDTSIPGLSACTVDVCMAVGCKLHELVTRVNGDPGHDSQGCACKHLLG
jgi:hypothetical protein